MQEQIQNSSQNLDSEQNKNQEQPPKKESFLFMIVKTPVIILIFVVFGIIIIGGGYIVKEQMKVKPIELIKPIDNKLEIFVDGDFKKMPDLELPIDIRGAGKIIEKFCKIKNPDYKYSCTKTGMKKVDGEWRIPIINLNCPCYATINIETGDTVCMKEIPFEKKEITITTDKTEYEQGEMMGITIINNRSEAIYISPYDFFPSNYSISRFEKDDWKTINQNCQCEFICDNGFLLSCPQFAPPYPYFSEFKSPKTGEWGQTECVSEKQMCGNESYNAIIERRVKAGEYKISFCYWDKKDIDLEKSVDYASQDKKKCVENEFTIKEKSALDPRCSEKVKDISGVGNVNYSVMSFGYEYNSLNKECAAVSIKGCSMKTPFKTLEECQDICEKKEADDTYKIYMKSRQFIPETGISDSLKSAIETILPERMHVLLQFHSIPGNEERSKLSDLNVVLCGYIHNNAYLAAIPTARLEEISNFLFIRSIENILPEDKLSSYIRDGKIGNWAINEDGTVNLIIQFFKDIPLDNAEQVIKQYGGITNSKVKSINTLVVSIFKDRIIELANEDIVQWVEQVSPPATTDGAITEELK